MLSGKYKLKTKKSISSKIESEIRADNSDLDDKKEEDSFFWNLTLKDAWEELRVKDWTNPFAQIDF